MASDLPKKRKPGSGRRAGVPNRLTKEVKTAIENAFVKVGGEDYLVAVAETDPKTFCALLGRVLPAQLNVKGSGEIGIKHKVEWHVIDPNNKPEDPKEISAFTTSDPL